jgi:hypothetical protein
MMGMQCERIVKISETPWQWATLLAALLAALLTTRIKMTLLSLPHTSTSGRPSFFTRSCFFPANRAGTSTVTVTPQSRCYPCPSIFIVTTGQLYSQLVGMMMMSGYDRFPSFLPFLWDRSRKNRIEILVK